MDSSIRPPSLRNAWTQHAAGAWHGLGADVAGQRISDRRERVKFQLRFDVNNVYKYHSFNPPNSTFNATDPSTFGTFNGTRGSFSDIGTGRWHGIIVGRLMW